MSSWSQQMEQSDPNDKSIMFDRGYIYELFNSDNNDAKQYWGLKKERLNANPDLNPFD